MSGFRGLAVLYFSWGVREAYIGYLFTPALDLDVCVLFVFLYLVRPLLQCLVEFSKYLGITILQ